MLTADDWVRILGTDPDKYDYTGIDAHMIESYAPRYGAGAPTFPTAPLLPALTGPGGESAAETAPGDGSRDPYNGGEWITNAGPRGGNAVDLQYACIFRLTTPHDCSTSDAGFNVQANGYTCDCSSTSPVCDPMNPDSQIFGKAYPTIRELALARNLGAQGIVSSICPIQVEDNVQGNDPLYGYRPAIAQIVNRVASTLAP